MTKLKVTGVTISLEIKQSTYGGQEAVNRFVSFKTEIPAGTEGLDMNEACLESLQLHLAVWESLHAAELAEGKTNKSEFVERLKTVQERLDILKKRTDKITTFLKESTT